ncbi:MAG: hypothetical protein ACI97P_001051 [Arcticibacterium sp.]|jgi:hypothetical protein
MEPKRKQPQSLHKIIPDFNNLSYLSADINYTHIHLQNGEKHTLSYTLKRFEDLLCTFNFIRIHRGHIINRNHIKTQNLSEVKISDGNVLPISRRRQLRGESLTLINSRAPIIKTQFQSKKLSFCFSFSLLFSQMPDTLSPLGMEAFQLLLALQATHSVMEQRLAIQIDYQDISRQETLILY